MADTAVLEPGTAADGDVTASEEALDLALPETESVDAPETDGEESPETEEAGPDFSEMSAEEIREYIKAEAERAAKDAEARTRESERRKRESEVAQARQEAEQRQMEARRTKAAQDRDGEMERDLRARIAEVVKHSLDEGQPFTLNPAALKDLVNRMAAMTAFDQLEAQAEVERKLLKEKFPNYRPSQDVAELLSVAERSGDAEKVVAARHAQVLEAARESVRAEVEAEVRASIEAERKAGAAKAQAAQRTDPRNSPTTVGVPGRGRALTNLQDYEKKLATEGLSDAEYNTYFALRAKSGL